MIPLYASPACAPHHAAWAVRGTDCRVAKAAVPSSAGKSRRIQSQLELQLRFVSVVHAEARIDVAGLIWKRAMTHNRLSLLACYMCS